jgi:hypothetical protein
VAIELGSVLFYVNRIPETMAVLEHALGETSMTGYPKPSRAPRSRFIASTWWMPETFPVAAARLEELDFENLHGGLGSDLLLADATFAGLHSNASQH